MGARVRVEELDLSIRAYHTLKVQNVDFIDQIDLDLLEDGLNPAATIDSLEQSKRRAVRAEIAMKLRRRRGDEGDAPVPS